MIHTSALILNAMPLVCPLRGKFLTITFLSLFTICSGYLLINLTLQVQVILLAGDETGATDLILFGRQAQRLVKKK